MTTTLAHLTIQELQVLLASTTLTEQSYEPVFDELERRQPELDQVE